MNFKYTSDGKKVVVIGSLNSKESIVQEIYVCDGTEVPAGEHFIVKTLLDAPAETYQTKKKRDLEESIKKLEAEREKVKFEIQLFRFTASAAAAKIKWIQGINEDEVERVFAHIKSVICGEYTHIVFNDYGGPQIKEWDAELFSKADGYGDNKRFDGIRLVSLFGEWNGRLGLDWRVHTYSDGSGSGRTSFTPCKSLQEAIDVVSKIIGSKEYITDGDVEVCLKYGIAIDEGKNLERLRKKRESKEKEITATIERLRKQEIELASIK